MPTESPTVIDADAPILCNVHLISDPFHSDDFHRPTLTSPPTTTTISAVATAMVWSVNHHLMFSTSDDIWLSPQPRIQSCKRVDATKSPGVFSLVWVCLHISSSINANTNMYWGHQHFHYGQEDSGKSMDQIRLALAGAAAQKSISRRPFLIFPHTIGENSFESPFSENRL